MRNSRTFYLAIMVIAVGILTNKWTVQSLLSRDGHITSVSLILVIALTQITIIALGIYLALRTPNIRIPSKIEIGLVVSGVLFAFSLAEISSRIWLNQFATPQQHRKYALYAGVEPQDMQWTRHHYLNYLPTPNYRRGLTYHNSLGYRSREFELKKPQGVYRVVALGGSTTYTINVEDNKKIFTYQLEKILTGDYSYKNVEVVNAGVGGYNSWESLINLQFRVLDLAPDLIIIYHGTNDVHARLVSPELYKGDNSGRRKQWTPPPVLLFEHSCILRIITRRLGLTAQVGLGSFVNSPNSPESGSIYEDMLRANPPVFFRRNLVNMVAIARAHGVEVLFASWAFSRYFNDYASTRHYQVGFAENNEVVKEVASLYKTHFFDFAKVMPQDKNYWSDGRHVNEEGAWLKAKLFAEFIHDSGLIHDHDTPPLEKFAVPSNSP